MSTNHLILFCSNKAVSGAIIAQNNYNKVYMLTGLRPGAAEKGRRLHKHSKCQQSCLWDFQLFVLRRLQADRVNYLWQNSPLLPPSSKKERKTWRWSCHLWNCKSGKVFLQQILNWDVRCELACELCCSFTGRNQNCPFFKIWSLKFGLHVTPVIELPEELNSFNWNFLWWCLVFQKHHFDLKPFASTPLETRLSIVNS